LSTHRQRVRECLALNYPVQFVRNYRYFAVVEWRLGLCIYILAHQGSCEYHAQLYPIPGAASTEQLQDCFVRYITTLAGQRGSEFTALRNQFGYMIAPDLLTLQCLIHEAHQKWRAIDAVERCDLNTGTGEGVV
jgi:hypothetical protein